MEEIQKVIIGIESKIAMMRNSLMEVKADNIALKTEAERLKIELTLKEQEAKDFKAKYDNLIHQYEQKGVDSKVNQPNNDAQIDALVREIDDCIGRLKAE